MISTILIVSLVTSIALLLFRFFLAISFKGYWREVCLHYIINTNPQEEYINYEEYAQTWPIIYIASYVWIWDFKKFIVNQESVDKILTAMMKSINNQE